MKTNELPTYPESREPAITDYHLIAPVLKEFELHISDNNFTNIFAWRTAYEYGISQLNGMIITEGVFNDHKFILPPLGDPDKAAKTVYDIFKIHEPGKDIPVLAATGIELADELMRMPNTRVTSDRGNWDYMHLSSALAQLSGPKYHAKRNLAKQFTTSHEYSIEELDTATCAEAIEFSDIWCKQRDCESDEGLKDEKCAIYQMLLHFEALRLHGVLVRVHGDIVALTMGELLTEDTYVVHVEKGDGNYKGIYQFLSQELAKIIEPDYKWINREQDLEIPGLRKAKLSYNPDHFIEKYRVDYTPRTA